jgi:hypothetical protein
VAAASPQAFLFFDKYMIFCAIEVKIELFIEPQRLVNENFSNNINFPLP